MDIAFIHPGWPGEGGTGAIHTSNIIVDCLNKRHNLTVYCTRDPPQKISEDTDYNLKVLRNHHLQHRSLRLNRSIKSRVTEFEQFDIVHSYIPILIPGVNEIADKTEAKTVISLNAYRGVCPKNDLMHMNSDYCDENGILRCLNCISRTTNSNSPSGEVNEIGSKMLNYFSVIHRSDLSRLNISGFHALSKHVKSTYVSFGIPSDRISVINNPADESFNIQNEADFDEPYELLFVGYLETHKGIHLLPEIMRQLSQSDVDFRLTIAGSGSQENKLKNEFIQNEVDDVVNFLGKVQYHNLPQIYAEHDIFIYPGIWQEPFGRVFLEALASGTPVVATDVGAAKEIIGTAGRVADTNSKQLVDCILSVIREKNLEEMSQNAKSKITEYSSELYISRLLDLYRNIL